ncbi:hypothetical protein Tco_0125749, partial [Tanacetum coccineum]
SLGGAVTSGHAGKSGDHVLRRQVDLLDFLAHSALARDVEYDQILEDDFGTATRAKEIDLTLFTLTPGPYQMSYPKSFNILSDLLVSHSAELNSRYTDLDGKLERMQKDYDTLVQENRELLSQKDDDPNKVKELQTELTDARVASIGLSGELSQTDAKLSDQALVVGDLQNQLILEKARSQGYKDDVD